MSESHRAVGLKGAQKGKAADVLARAFHADPAYRQLVPDSNERTRALRALFAAVVGYSLRYGQVHTTSDLGGAACWLTPGNTDITFWRMLRTGLGFQRAMAKFRPDARRQLLDALAHLQEIQLRLMARPHWYLWALGVEPAYQGRGIGSELIRPALAQSDLEEAPCYLETQSERTLAFYARHGFEVVSEGVLPGLGLKSWSMLREPRR
jgi:ribosomal protein S18 acetylase RimI-like enzyme